MWLILILRAMRCKLTLDVWRRKIVGV